MNDKDKEAKPVDDPTKILREGGWKPKANVDENYPAFEGEYAVAVEALKPFTSKATGEKDSYGLTWKVTETINGEEAAGRTLTQFYRIAGTRREFGPNYNIDQNDYKDVPVTGEDAAKAVGQLVNDLFTAGVSMDVSSLAALEESFPAAIGAKGFARAYRKRGSGKQGFVIKRKEDLRKGGTVTKKDDQIPF